MSVTTDPANPAPARPAASLILVRTGAAGPEVLMGLRGARHRFMPNRLVFPGGAIDPADHDAAVAEWPDPAVLARLEAGADPALARAVPVAAARELAEETGLSLGAPPALGAIDYLCRAITPAASPVRFDARFLVVPAEHATGALGGSGELEGLRWYGVTDALALDLATVTFQVLGKLTTWLRLPPEARLRRPLVPVFREERWGWI